MMMAGKRIDGAKVPYAEFLVAYRIELAMLSAFVLLCGVIGVLAPRFLTAGNINNLFWQATTVGIIAVGQTLIILTGGIDLSVGGIAAIATMIGGIILLKFGLVVGIISILMIGAMMGFVNGYLVSYTQLAPFIVTLGVQAITRSLTYVSMNGHTLTRLPVGYRFFGTGTVFGMEFYTIVFVGLFVLGHILLTKTKPGRFWYAIGSNEEAARLAGVNVRFYKSLVYVITGVLCAVAGLILTSRLGAVDPDTASGIELDTIAAVVIGGCSLAGGKGSLFGTFIGVFIITVLHNGLNLIGVSPFWQGSAVGAVIILSVLMDRVLRRRG
jgi:ribose transport system permease protein